MAIEAVEFKGTVLAAGEAGYDEARAVFNSMVDRRPARIMRCTDAEDVVAALAAARDEGLQISVYGGGHGVLGSAVVDGGMCIDLRGIDHVEVDAAARTVHVGGGATWGQVDAATQAHGLAVTGGRVSSTGVGGLTLGSGSGWLERSLGFVCDNLLSATVVVADGRVVTASAEENPDLFWALRGGGGNFGIVVDFELRLHEVGPLLLAGMLLYPGELGAEVLKNFRDVMADAPDEVGGGVAFITAPPADFVPEPARGKPCVGVILCYNGDVEEGRRVMAPLLEFGEPAVSMVQPMPYVAVQQLIDAPSPKGMRNYWTADFMTGLPDEAIDTLTGFTSTPASPLTQVIVVPGGGAISRVPEDETAFGQRSAPWNIHYLSMWAPDPALDEANIDYTRQMAGTMKKWTTGQVYLNFIGDEGLDRVAAAYGPARYQRLREIKRDWDPQNVFCHNQNILPAPDASLPQQR